jgi:hypothetical protein
LKRRLQPLKILKKEEGKTRVAAGKVTGNTGQIIKGEAEKVKSLSNFYVYTTLPNSQISRPFMNCWV